MIRVCESRGLWDGDAVSVCNAGHQGESRTYKQTWDVGKTALMRIVPASPLGVLRSVLARPWGFC